MIAVILPTFCEAQNIEELIKRLEELKLDLWIVVVDDSSPDGTAEVVKRIMEIYDNITLIERPRKLGIGAAILTGLEFISSSGKRVDYVSVMDADLSHDPKELPMLVNGVCCSDVVVGSRYVRGGKIEGWGLSRRLISRIANLLANKILRLGIRDATSGYRVYRLEALLKVIDRIENMGFSFQVESLYRLIKSGFSVEEKPIKFVNRKRGSSKLNSREILSFIRTLLKLKSSELKS
ncbi:MAG: polyprenol monophosphomannose synthase [Candidatus Bathyarchaeia archaeon]